MSVLPRIVERLQTSRTITVREKSGELALELPDGSEVLAIEHQRGDEHAIVLLAWICAERNADPAQMLRLVAHMGAGAIALVGRAYVIRYTIPAAQLDAAPLEQLVPYLSRAAIAIGNELEAQRFTATEALDEFAHLGA